MRAILVATDFSECARAATRLAAELARALGGSLALLHVHPVPRPTLPPAQAEWPDAVLRVPLQAKEALAAERDGLETAELVVDALLRDGDPAEEIVRAAVLSRPSLIAMGTHGRVGIAHALLGSVAERVVRLAPCPVLTVRAPRSRNG
jgi:nucleotide-binding universal stress UspA family protein